MQSALLSSVSLFFLPEALQPWSFLVKIFKQWIICFTGFRGFEIAVTLRHLAQDYSNKYIHQRPLALPRARQS